MKIIPVHCSSLKFNELQFSDLKISDLQFREVQFSAVKFSALYSCVLGIVLSEVLGVTTRLVKY